MYSIIVPGTKPVKISYAWSSDRLLILYCALSDPYEASSLYGGHTVGDGELLARIQQKPTGIDKGDTHYVFARVRSMACFISVVKFFFIFYVFVRGFKELVWAFPSSALRLTLRRGGEGGGRSADLIQTPGNVKQGAPFRARRQAPTSAFHSYGYLTSRCRFSFSLLQIDSCGT